MLLKHAFPALLVLGLTGCVAAVPLGQLAVKQMSPARPPCVAGPECQSTLPVGSLGSLTKGFTDSVHKLAGEMPDPQTAAAAPPAK
jgi:hypothetical protein